MPAFIFNPSDAHLVEYLNAKIIEENDEATESNINEISLCRYEPEDIPHLTQIPSTHTWHVISALERRNGLRRLIMRSTKRGFWKVTGRDVMVKDHYGNTVGFKKYLTFYEKDGNASADDFSSRARNHKKTGWKIHELHSFIQHPKKDKYVLCKLMKDPIVPSSNVVPAVVSSVAEVTDPILHHQMQNDTNLIEDICGGLDDFPAGFQSSDLDPLFRDFDRDINVSDMIANWNSGRA